MAATSDADAIPDGGAPVAGVAAYSESGWVDPAVAHERIGRCENRSLLELILRELERRVRDEEDRQATLERKAATLLGAVGVCVSIFAALGATEVRAIVGASALTWFDTALVAGVFAAAILGLTAAFLAVRTLRTRSHDRTNDEIVLNDHVLRAQRGPDSGSEPVPMAYLRLLARGSWDVANTTRAINDQKVRSVVWAQRTFLLFLIGVLLVGVGRMLHPIVA